MFVCANENTDPKYKPGVLPVPAAAFVVGEEAPGVFVVLVWHEDADAANLVRFGEHVLFPDHGEEEGACGVHNGDVGEDPAPVVGLEGLYDA